jgi:hypothetical protein
MVSGKKSAMDYQQFISGKVHWAQLITCLLLLKT